ncbi:hypothetical protein [Streptomyces sp. NBC_00557]|uniref:hypothetical protein n=1 Tax=Streptomyces sp. NBC_00557 TaxID=2975776 RepID=UPI002E81C011|nr:hypothetical protein [Streptomyces sp. NBC_00557]WUC39296.1 hypothetical protein OG956_36235 [Streptomyces sp. NBC_00557]
MTVDEIQRSAASHLAYRHTDKTTPSKQKQAAARSGQQRPIPPNFPADRAPQTSVSRAALLTGEADRTDR